MKSEHLGKRKKCWPFSSAPRHFFLKFDLLSESNTLGNGIALSNGTSLGKDFTEPDTDNTHDWVRLSQSTVSNNDSNNGVCEISNEHFMSSLKVGVGRVLLDSSLVNHFVVDDELSITGWQVVRLFRGNISILTSLSFSFSACSSQILSFKVVDLFVSSTSV